MPLELKDWQKEAIDAWKSRHYKGMVEAVTGSGKSYLALGAIEHLWPQHKPLNTLIVVPTTALLKQWFDKLQEAFPGRPVARLGGGHNQTFANGPTCIAVINSAAAKLESLFGHCRRGLVKSFLIADECHRYVNGPFFSRIRQHEYNFVMGLSATIDDYDIPGFGKICYSYTFGRALKDDLVPPFSLMNVQVNLTPGEWEQYERLSKQVSTKLLQIREIYGPELPSPNDRRFWIRLRQLLATDPSPKTSPITQLFGLLFKRASILYTAENKMALAKVLIDLLIQKGRRKVIVYFERMQSADEVQEDLEFETAKLLQAQLKRDLPYFCEVLHSGHSQRDRDDTLRKFRQASPAVLLACRVLDEGIDIRDLDSAVLVASTQKRRQRIQRIGRVLRKVEGAPNPVVITLYVPLTGDERVVENDGEVFGDIARISYVPEGRAIQELHELLTQDEPNHAVLKAFKGPK